MGPVPGSRLDQTARSHRPNPLLLLYNMAALAERLCRERPLRLITNGREEFT